MVISTINSIKLLRAESLMFSESLLYYALVLFDMGEIPEFSEDSVQQTLANNDPLSSSPIKGAIKWNRRDNCYTFVWWQTPFYIATPNGGYSMTESFFENLPDHIDQIWVVDDDKEKFRRFNRSQYENGTIIDPDSDKFKNVTPDRQVAVDVEKCQEEYELADVEL